MIVYVEPYPWQYWYSTNQPESSEEDEGVGAQLCLNLNTVLPRNVSVVAVTI